MRSPTVASSPDNTIETSDAIGRKAADRRKIAYAIHAAILILAVLYWGKFAFLDAPFVYHPDEADVVGRAVRMLMTGDFNPHWFHYPTLLTYVNAAVLKVLNVVVDLPLERGLAIGVRGVDPNAFVLYEISRFITICFSLGTLFLLLRLTTRFTNPFMASLAGITFLGSNIVFASAARVTVDMPVTFFVLASLAMMVRFVDSGREGKTKERYYWAAIVLGGLAAGTKYNGAAVLFAAPVVLWLVKVPPARALRLLVLGAALSIAVFLATTPYAVLDAKTFLHPGIGMVYDFRHYASGHPGADEGIAFLKLTRDLLTQHSILVICCLLIPAVFIKKDYPRSLLLVVFLLVLYLVMVGSAKVYFSRNFLPALPLADCLAAITVWAIALNLRKKESRSRFIPASIIAIVFLVAGFTTSLSARETLLAQRRIDSRTVAYEWIMANIPRNTRILYEAYCPQLYYSGKFVTGYAWSLSEVPFEQIVQNYDLVVTSDYQWKRYQDLQLKSHGQVFKLPLLKEWPNQENSVRGPSIRIYSTRATTLNPSHN